MKQWSREKESQIYRVMRTVKNVDYESRRYIVDKCEKMLCDECSNLTQEEKLNIVENAIIKYIKKCISASYTSIEVSKVIFEMGHFYYISNEREKAEMLFGLSFKMINEILKSDGS